MKHTGRVNEWVIPLGNWSVILLGTLCETVADTQNCPTERKGSRGIYPPAPAGVDSRLLLGALTPQHFQLCACWPSTRLLPRKALGQEDTGA